MTTFNLNENGRLVEEMATPATPLSVGQIITYEDRANPRKEFAILGAVPAGRFKGWLRNAKEAAEELQDDQAAQYWNGNAQITAGSPFALLAAKNAAE